MEENYMSSFLDSTGLSRLVSKITDYFAKKDGTYPDMTAGNATNADTAGGTSVTQIGSTNVDLDDYKGGTTVKYYMWSSGEATNVAHKPFSNASFLVVYPQVGASGWGRQVCFDRSNQHFATREYTGSQWTTWREIALDTGNYPDMTVGKVVGSKVGEEWNPIYIASDGTPTACPTVLRRPADISNGKLNWLFNNASFVTFGTNVNLDIKIAPTNTTIAHILFVQNTASSNITITAHGVDTTIASKSYAVFQWNISGYWEFAGKLFA
jgi:hypothetical protein